MELSSHLPMALLPNIGTTELVVIFLVVLLFFGARRLPELARGLGKSMKEFKKATSEAEEDFREAMESADPNKADPNKAEPPKVEKPKESVPPSSAEAPATKQEAPASKR